MFAKLPSVMNDGLAIEKNTNSAISVIKGAMLRNWLRRKWAGSNRWTRRFTISVMSAFLVHDASVRYRSRLRQHRSPLVYQPPFCFSRGRQQIRFFHASLFEGGGRGGGGGGGGGF